MQLHYTHGFKDTDKAWLDKHHNTGKPANTWNVPKCAEIGDAVLIVVGGWVYASGIINSNPTYRKDWRPAHRYSAQLTGIRLVKPTSLHELRRRWPSWKWAEYPRS